MQATRSKKDLQVRTLRGKSMPPLEATATLFWQAARAAAASSARIENRTAMVLLAICTPLLEHKILAGSRMPLGAGREGTSHVIARCQFGKQVFGLKAATQHTRSVGVAPSMHSEESSTESDYYVHGHLHA